MHRSTAVLVALSSFLFFVFTGCATPRATIANAKPEPVAAQIEPEEEIKKLDDAIEDPALIAPKGSESEEDVDFEALRETLRGRTGIPSEVNSMVRKWIEYFTGRDRERFQRFLERGERYRALVQQTLIEHGVPADLYYLAMIESGYVTHARSNASAVGLWQFIPATGRRYGLYSSKYIDERRDPIRATEAAARYLRDLYARFQSWHLAMAAYNAGEGRIARAITRSRSRDFWELARRHTLPQETMNYVPKFLAALAIGRNPARYGFQVGGDEEGPNLVAVRVPSPIRLQDVATVSRVPLEALKEANPHLKKDVTSVVQKEYEIWVPEQFSSKVVLARSRLSSYRLHGLRESRSIAIVETPRTHRVEKGETLGSIANSYGVPISYIAKINKMRRSSHLKPGTLLRVAANEVRGSAFGRKVYRVKKGDTIHRIARKAGIPSRRLLKLNPWIRGKLVAGQRINIR